MKLIFGLDPELYQELISIFAKYPKISKVLIFGSRSKNTAKPHSDFDLAIVAPQMSDQEFSQLWNEVDDLPLIFKFDLLHFDFLNNAQLKEKILKEGKIFYPK